MGCRRPGTVVERPIGGVRLVSTRTSRPAFGAMKVSLLMWNCRSRPRLDLRHFGLSGSWSCVPPTAATCTILLKKSFLRRCQFAMRVDCYRCVRRRIAQGLNWRCMVAFKRQFRSPPRQEICTVAMGLNFPGPSRKGTFSTEYARKRPVECPCSEISIVLEGNRVFLPFSIFLPIAPVANEVITGENLCQRLPTAH